MKKVLLTILFSALFIAPAIAQQGPQTITLKDGTSIKGQLTGVANGVYTVHSATMGEVKVPASEIASINAAGVAPAASSSSAPANADGKMSADTINSLKDNMLQDPEVMALVQELVKDPEIAAIMMNPSVMQAALSMDPERIKNNPDVQKLMQNPTMQKILALTAQKMQNQ